MSKADPMSAVTDAERIAALPKSKTNSKKAASSNKPGTGKMKTKTAKQKKMARLASGLGGLKKIISKQDPASGVSSKELARAMSKSQNPVLSKMKNAAKLSDPNAAVSDSEYRTSMKKLRANRIKNDKEYKKNN